MKIASMLETPQVDWLKAHSERKEIHGRGVRDRR